MKKNLKQTAVVFLALAFACSSCKKDDDNPAPANTTPVNQSSTTAPSLNAGATTTFTTTTGSGNAGIVCLGCDVTDPQGDDWDITSITSSNTSVATVERAEGGFKYTGVTPGTVTITIVVTDENSNANTLTYTIVITQAPDAPTLNSGVNTTLYVQEGSNTSWNLSNKVTDHQGDFWTVHSVSSSNPGIVSVEVDELKSVNYVGRTAGTTTITVTVSDEHHNVGTFNATIHVTPKPSKPVIIIEK